MAYKCVFWLEGPEFHKSILKCYCQFYPLNLQDFFFLLPDLKNKQVQKLFNSGGAGILSGWRFHFILVKGGHDGGCFNILLLKLSDTLKYNRFYRKHTLPIAQIQQLLFHYSCYITYLSSCLHLH